jgi:hypothetical protein
MSTRIRGGISRVMVHYCCGIGKLNRNYLLFSVGNDAFDHYNRRTVSGRVGGRKDFGSYRRRPHRIAHNSATRLGFSDANAGVRDGEYAQGTKNCW